LTRKATLRFTILGCGASPGVPRINGDWGACDPAEPRNRRTRSAALVELLGDGKRPTRVVIDTGPDLRSQLIAAGVDAIDGVVYTHAHADHVHGIDDLRTFWMVQRQPVQVYTDDATQRRLDDAFGYCFRTQPGSSYPSFLVRNRIEPGTPIKVRGPSGAIALLPFEQTHGDIISVGYRIGPIAYSCDFNDIPEHSLPPLRDLDLWVLDALRHRPHPSHCTMEEAVAWVERITPKRAWLTHMTNDLDYQTLTDTLPDHIRPAYDGLSVDVEIIARVVQETSASP